MYSLVVLLVFVGWAYSMYVGRSPTTGGVLGLLIGVVGAMAAFDGGTLAMREYERAQNARETTGVIIGKSSSADTDRSQRWVPRRRLRHFRQWVPSEGFNVHDVLGRLIRTGSPTAWIVDYRYECARSQGCTGRDFVTEELWHRLNAGQAISVRRSKRENEFSRLDENPQWGRAIVDLAIGGALLFAAGRLLGYFKASGRRRYLTVPAVVIASDPVQYSGATRWRIRFAYFDPQGVAQETVNEVLTDAFKPGDECLAVFPPHQPDLASIRPLHAA